MHMHFKKPLCITGILFLFFIFHQKGFFKGMVFEEKTHGAERYGIENKYKCKLFC